MDTNHEITLDGDLVDVAELNRQGRPLLDEILAKEAAELGELLDDFDRVVEMKDFKPNRQQRRAAERKQKRDRTLQKRNPRG